MSEQFEKIVEVGPAYDKRNQDPHKNYGIGSATLRFILRGSKGVMQFVVYTGWHLPHNQMELIQRCSGGSDGYCRMAAQPADVGYHSPVPVYDGQHAVSDSCEYLGGKPCYYDGSSLQAEDVFKLMVEKGHDAMWRELEERYYLTFGYGVSNG